MKVLTRKKQVDTSYAAFQKSFDNVHHDIRLIKLGTSGSSFRVLRVLYLGYWIFN